MLENTFQVIEFKDYDLQKKYDYYNALLFNNALPKIPIIYKKLKNAGGMVKVKLKNLNPKGRTKLTGKYHGAQIVEGSHRIIISTMFKRSEEGLDGILVHEMIHVYFNSIGKFDVSHGKPFMDMLDKLNQKVPFKIPLTDKIEKLEINDKTKLKIVAVQIIYKKEGFPSFAIIDCNNMKKTLPEFIKRWKNMIIYGNNVKTEFYIIASEKWTEMANRYTIQRRKPINISYCKLNDEYALQDLIVNGHIFETISK